MFALVERSPNRFVAPYFSADLGIAAPEPGNVLSDLVGYINLL